MDLFKKQIAKIADSKLQQKKNAIKLTKNDLDKMYNILTNEIDQPTPNTYNKAAFFNKERERYEFMAGPYRRRNFPTDEQIQGRISYMKTPSGQMELNNFLTEPDNEYSIIDNVVRRKQTKGNNLLKSIKQLRELNAIENMSKNINRISPGGGAGGSASIKVTPGAFNKLKVDLDNLSNLRENINRISPGVGASTSIKVKPGAFNKLKVDLGNVSNLRENLGSNDNNWVFVNENSLKGGKRNCTYKKSSRKRSRRRTHSKRRN